MISAQPIVAFVSDLISASRIGSTAQSLGFEVIWVEQPDQLLPLPAGAPFLPVDAPPELAEHLTGPGAALLEALTRWKPGLLLFDLGNDKIPWRTWIALIKSAPATRRLPLICFGSHVASETLTTARDMGADGVFARSRFFNDLPALITQFARQSDSQVLAETCQQPLSPAALKGLELFNNREYFEAHEALEKAWKQEPSPGRELYRAILQVAVAYLQIERSNYRGALKMFLRLRQWIDPLPDICRGVDVARLRQDAESVHLRLRELGPDGIQGFDQLLFKPVVYNRS